MAFFIRNPVPGQVKTRLATGVGDDQACELYSCFVQDMLTMLDGIGMAVQVFYSPPKEGKKVEEWLGSQRPLHPQRGQDLGDKMRLAFDQIFQQGYEKSLLIGSDIPDLPGSRLKDAEEILDTYPCVFGPSLDGGYFLVGFGRDSFYPQVFSGPQWGTSRVLEQTLDILKNNAVQTSLIKPWRDVDDLDDLLALRERLKQGLSHAPATRSLLEGLMSNMPGSGQ